MSNEPYPQLDVVEDRGIFDVQRAVAEALYGSVELPKHRYEVIPDPETGSLFIHFPELPGCMTQAIDPYEVGYMAADAYAVWVASCNEDGIAIPEPNYDVVTALDAQDSAE